MSTATIRFYGTVRLLLGCLLWIAILGTLKAQHDAYEKPPIDYLNAEVHDAVAVLSAKIQSGEVKLVHEGSFGYLKSLLKELDVPVSSQTLVFSKTSLQLQRISPRRPRSLYFNDEVYVGFCQQGEVLELAATDARQGAIFYTLDQSQDGAVKIVRDQGVCLSCHASGRTQNVPGYLIRSVATDAGGQPKLGSRTYTTDHTSNFLHRWGGWYVSGKHGSMRHMGNKIFGKESEESDLDEGANLTDLSDRFRVESYLSPHSDLVALMVLEHQSQMHNAIAAANYETRQALFQSYQMNEMLGRPEGHVSESAQRRIASAADRVLKYLLMCDEFQLTDSVSGPTEFAKEFTSRGKKDSKGRSLREFDLKTRLFKYPCSYLIESPAFDGLPPEVRRLVVQRLIAILEGRDDSMIHPQMTAELRRDTLEILQGIKPEFFVASLDGN